MNVTSLEWLLLVVAELIYVTHANWITGNLCWSMPCMNGGSCFGSAYTYLCVCPANFSGALCEKRLGICQESPCGNRGLCVETGLSSFECRCYFDYVGPLCEEHVPKNDPSVWSSLIPVHTRVLFDILQEAYYAKTHGRAPSDAQNDQIEFSVSPLGNGKSLPSSTKTTTTTTPSTTYQSTSSDQQSDTTEDEHILRAEDIQMKNIFPEMNTESTAETYTDHLTTSLTEGHGSDNATDLSASSELQTTPSSITITTDSISNTGLLHTDTDSMITETLEEDQTTSAHFTAAQESTGANEASSMASSSSYDEELSDTNANSTLLPPTDMLENSTEQNNAATTTAQSTPQTSLQTSGYSFDQTDNHRLDTTEQTAASMMLTTDPSIDTINMTQTSHSQLLYKLCQQLLSHILPNVSSTAAVEAALLLTSDLPATGNHSASALLTWFQQQMSTSTSTTTAATTTTSSVSPSLLNGNERSLHRVDVDDVLHQMNNDIDDEH